MLSTAVEQRIVVKFLTKLGKTATETYNLLKGVYGSECLSRARVFEWFKRFQTGREDVKDDLRPGRPSTSKTDGNIKQIGDLLRSDRRLSIRAIAEIVGIDKESVRQILHNDFNIQKVCNKMVPKTLSFEQQEARNNFCIDTLNAIENEPNLLERIITCDDSWFCTYEPDTKCPTSSLMKKPRTRFKARMIVFFDIHGIVLHDWVPEGETINPNYYLHVLAQLQERIREKRQELWKDKSWVLYQTNNPAYSALSVKKFLAKYSIAVLSHPPCSPDLSPCDFHLFPKVTFALKMTRFGSVEAVKERATSVLMEMTEKDFQHCFQLWKIRMERCRDRGGGYIEAEQEIFNTAPDSEEETNIKIKVEDTSGSSPGDNHFSETVSQGRSQNTNTNQWPVTELSTDIFSNSRNIKEEPSEFEFEVMDYIKTENFDFETEDDSKNDTNSKDSKRKNGNIE